MKPIPYRPVSVGRVPLCAFVIERKGFWPFYWGRRLRLTAPYRLDWLVIPAVYRWDGPSFMGLRRSLIEASLIHDVLYRYAVRPDWKRQEADGLAIEIAKACGGDFGILERPEVQPTLELAWRQRWIGDLTGFF